ncbi:MAG: hypothetical protein ACREGG_04025 [Candidatus Saccharimonadales bacterium]
MTKTANYNREYEKELLARGVKLWPRMIEVPNGCWLCGKTKAKLTNAKLFPDWLLEAFNCGNDMYTSAHLSPLGQVLDQRETPFKDLACGQICQECIDGWISELDTDMKPLFLGDVNKALDEQPLLMARFFAKTAALINISQQRRVQLPAAARHGLSNKKTMPKGWRVYAFSCSTEGLDTISWTQGSPAVSWLSKEQDKITLGNVFVCSLKFNNLGALVYWHSEEVQLLEPALPLKRLWPNPTGTLSDVAYHPYMGMFVADIHGNKAGWAELLADARAQAADPDVDLFDFSR